MIVFKYFVRVSLLAVISIYLLAGYMPSAALAAKPPKDLTQLSMTESVNLLKSGKLKSETLVRAYLAKIKTRSDLNAFITVDEVGALAAAKKADTDRAAGKVVGLLQGIPIVVKDNFLVKNIAGAGGTPALKTLVPTADAPVIDTLRKAGAIILAKTNMHELAFGISGYNQAFPNPITGSIGVRNAYDTTRFAGGSSSGNGSAIGARLVGAGIGTDTGGSSRIPAAVNGIAGFRPTVGRYSGEGIVPLSHTRDTAGPMGQTVSDVALLDAVIAREGAINASDLRKVRIGVARDYFFQNLDADTTKVIADTLAKLTAAGATIVETSMPTLKTLNDAVSFPIVFKEAYDDMVAFLAKYKSDVTIDQLAANIASADVKGAFGAVTGHAFDAGYTAAMLTSRPALQKLYLDTFTASALDVIIFPTTPVIAIKQNADASSNANFGLFIQNTDPGANAGLPGLTIPAGLGASGMPVGVEIDGPVGSDRKVLSIGLAIEKVLGRTPAPK
jgi:Asp-tRNA(Asn)/Glu-tRNA(Gln) amidotransferase A subunit family amidase